MTVPYEYALLRAVPLADRGELVNVGVLLYCQDRDFLGCAIDLDGARVLALDPRADLDAVRQALASFRAVCAGDERSGAAGGESRRARFGWLTAPRSTVVRPGPVHSGLTADPARELEVLVARLVSRPSDPG